MITIGIVLVEKLLDLLIRKNMDLAFFQLFTQVIYKHLFTWRCGNINMLQFLFSKGADNIISKTGRSCKNRQK